MFVDFTHNRLFYRKVYVLNANNIPKDGHLIFTPNHQNALMDALALLCNIDKQLVFLARSDIFKKKFIASILYFLRILPIFRIRDGYSAVKKNSSIFQKTMDVINAQNGLVILPEGNHEGVHQLRPLKKGFARIAFQTEEESNFTLNIEIIPVGLHYSDYVKSRSDLYINFGKPISVSDYYEQYKESPAKAVNKITKDLAERIKSQMVHVSSDKYYKLYYSIKSLYWRTIYENSGIQRNQKFERIKAEQKVITLLEYIEKESPQKFAELTKLNENFTEKLRDFDLKKFVFNKPFGILSLLFQSIGFLVCFPLFIYGLLTNLIPLFIVKFAESRIKDLQFKSSFKYVISILVFPLYYIIPLVLISIFCSSMIMGMLILLSLPFSGLFTIIYHHAFADFKAQWKVCFFKFRNPSQFEKTKKIKTSMDQLINDAKINFQAVD